MSEKRPTIRELARRLGVSAATVSLALRGDARVNAATVERVKAGAAAAGYHADPVVAEGLSRARRREFFRETLVWVVDRRRAETPWLEPLFAAAEEQARQLGYRIEFVRLSREPAALRRAARVWRARGVRGVALGPFAEAWTEPALRWGDFAWVSIGEAVTSPRLHRVGRDYAADVDRAVEELAAAGCRRIGFVGEALVAHLFARPLRRAALEWWATAGVAGAESGCEPYLEINGGTGVKELRRWRRTLEPDALVVARGLGPRATELAPLLADLPRRCLSAEGWGEPDFEPNYAAMGAAAVNVLHRHLTRKAWGVPTETETTLAASFRRRGSVL